MKNEEKLKKTAGGRDCLILAGDICDDEYVRSAVAKTVEIIQPSPYRHEDGCPFSKSCGGCTFQHITYEEECKFKENTVNDQCNKKIFFDFCKKIILFGHLIFYRPSHLAAAREIYNNYILSCKVISRFFSYFPVFSSDKRQSVQLF